MRHLKKGRKLNMPETIQIQNNRKCVHKKVDVINELNKRFGMPIYVPLLSLIACFMLSSRKENKTSKISQYFYILIGFSILVLAEIAVRFSGKLLFISFLYYAAPIVMMIISYFILFRVFKYENLET